MFQFSKIWLLPTLIVALGGCHRLSIKEIRSIEKTPFNNLELYADAEFHSMRIDVIRQQNTSYDTDTTTVTEPRDYHPVGLNLGNGLFYDHYGNLSIRVDYLLNFSSDQPFRLEKHIKPKNPKKHTVRIYSNDSIIVENLYTNRAKYTFHTTGFGDSTAIMKKNRMKYAIVKSDTSVICQRNNGKPVGVYEIEENVFVMKLKKDTSKYKAYYKLTPEGIFLGKKYLVRRSTNGDRLKIYSQRKNKTPRLIYTIVKNDKILYFYNDKGQGKKIEIGKNTLSVSGSSIKPSKYELNSTDTAVLD